MITTRYYIVEIDIGFGIDMTVQSVWLSSVFKLLLYPMFCHAAIFRGYNSSFVDSGGVVCVGVSLAAPSACFNT